MSYPSWWMIIVLSIGTPLYLLRMGELFSLFMCFALFALVAPYTIRRDDDFDDE